MLGIISNICSVECKFSSATTQAFFGNRSTELSLRELSNKVCMLYSMYGRSVLAAKECDDVSLSWLNWE